MNELNDDIWQFPIAQFPIKVIGTAHTALAGTVQDIIARHTNIACMRKPQKRLSRNGKYVSLTVFAYLENQAQVKNIYAELDQCELIRWVI